MDGVSLLLPHTPILHNPSILFSSYPSLTFSPLDSPGGSDCGMIGVNVDTNYFEIGASYGEL